MTTLRGRVSDLEDRVDALEEEIGLDEDPTRSPEDVADVWLKVEGDGTRYLPDTESARVTSGCICGVPIIVEAPLAVWPNGAVEHNGKKFCGEAVETVDAADVPAEEVPADE